MVFCQQVAGKVGYAHPDGRLVQRGDEDGGATGRKANQSRSAPACRGAKFAFVDEAQIAQHLQPVGDHRAPEFTLAFEFLTGVGRTAAHEVQEFDQRGGGRLDRARTPFAALAGRFGQVGAGRRQNGSS